MSGTEDKWTVSTLPPRRPRVAGLVKDQRPPAAPDNALPPPEPARPAATPHARSADGSTPAKPKAKAPTERLSGYVDREVWNRARNAFMATSYEEDDESWSDFMAKAILAEAERREGVYNGGQPYPARATRVPQGRPIRRA